MKDVFISGWCGYPELFGDFADEFEFVVPFLTHSLQDISELLEAGGKNLFAWSTGSYIVLDQSDKPNFDNIVLAAPFKKFTTYTPERILKKMIQRFVQSPQKVIEDFFNRCASDETPEYLEEHFDIHLKVLEFLMETDINKVKWDLDDVTLLHGLDDVIVNPEASREIGNFVTLEGVGHFIPAEVLKQYKI